VGAIVERQDTIAFFKENSMAEQAHQLRTALRKMGDVHSGLNAIRRGGIPCFDISDRSDQAQVREKVLWRSGVEILVICISCNAQY